MDESITIPLPKCFEGKSALLPLWRILKETLIESIEDVSKSSLISLMHDLLEVCHKHRTSYLHKKLDDQLNNIKKELADNLEKTKKRKML
jgi:hypothetical protein